METNKIKLSFAAINPYIIDNKQSPIEKEIPGKDVIAWGENNRYPFYLFDLYSNVPTLKSIIDGCVDYIAGEGIKTDEIVDVDYINELIRDLATSYMIYGGFAINVQRNYAGEIVKLSAMDFRKLRTNKNGSIIYYSNDYNTKTYGRIKYTGYPAFDISKTSDYNSIFYYKNDKYSVYPTPMYGAAITGCELERSIDEFQINSINNGFMGSVLVSLNNGVPDDEIKDEVEKNFNEKFTGKENAGRVVISYSDDKEHAAEITQIQTEDFSARYKALAERSQQQIFTAFRATPALFGIPTNDKGFAKEQYKDQYTLFYNTVIRPIQKLIMSKINMLLNENFELVPFSLDFSDGETNDKNIETE